MGDWKLVAEKEKEGTWELYDLKTDRIESKGLSAQFPDKVNEMAAKWQALDEEFNKQGGGTASRRPQRRSPK